MRAFRLGQQQSLVGVANRDAVDKAVAYPQQGTEPWHNAKLLVKFNEFMHFRPAWDDDDIHSGRFVEEVKRKVPVATAYKVTFMFPYGFMTYGCAK